MSHEERTLRAEVDSPSSSPEMWDISNALWNIAKTLAVIADILEDMRDESGALRISQPLTSEEWKQRH